MKTILMLIMIAFAPTLSAMSIDSVRTAVICEAGYKFLIVYSGGIKRPPSVVQIYERVRSSKTYPPQPMKCSK